MLQLVLGEYREPVWKVLEAVLSGEPGIELWYVEKSALSARRDLDAFIVMSLYAHERLGYPFGPPRQSRVLSTKGNPNMPPWFVTTPTYPARIVFDGSETLKAVPLDPPLSPPEETYELFTKVFEAVEAFNHADGSSSIQRLGCNLESIRVPITPTEPDMWSEIESIRQAYREHAERTGLP